MRNCRGTCYFFFFTFPIAIAAAVEKNQIDSSLSSKQAQDEAATGSVVYEINADLYDPLEAAMDSPAVDANVPASISSATAAVTDTANLEEESKIDLKDDSVVENNDERPSSSATRERSESPIFPLVNKDTSDAIFPDTTDAGSDREDDADISPSSAPAVLTNEIEQPSAVPANTLSKADIVQESQNNDDEMEVLNDAGSPTTDITPATTSAEKDIVEESNIEHNEQPVAADGTDKIVSPVDEKSQEHGDQTELPLDSVSGPGSEEMPFDNMEENLDDRSPSP